MLSASPRALDPTPHDHLPLPAPEALVERYVDLVAQRRAIEDQLAFVRSELELVAASALDATRPRGRFRGVTADVTARLQPTLAFDRAVVAKELQRQGRLADVAILQGPALARYLAKEPVVAARLGALVRPRHHVVLMSTG